MSIEAKLRSKACSLFALAALLAACNTGPEPPKPGSPAYNWEAAQRAYKGGDYLKATDLLVQLGKTDNDFSARARPWALVMSIGTAKAYMELAEKFEEGAKAAKTNPAQFRSRIVGYKAKATGAGMQAVETARRFSAAGEAKDVVFVFTPPEAPLDDPPQLAKVVKGQPMPEAEIGVLERTVLKREILRQACIALNAAKDPAKARAAYQNNEARPEAFPFMLGKGLYDVAQIFGLKKLNQPTRVIKALYDETGKAFAQVKDNKEAKEIAKKAADANAKLKED